MRNCSRPTASTPRCTGSPDASAMPDLSIIIVNWNTRDLLLDCLAAVAATCRDLSHEVLVVDNGSQDGSVAAVRRRFPAVTVIANQDNLGFARANNQALARMAGRYALLLNSDAILKPGAAARLLAFMEDNPRVAAACGQLLNEDGSRQNSIATFPSALGLVCNETLLRLLWPSRFPSKHRTYRQPLPVDSCIGACMIVRRQAIDEVGPLDERYFFYFEETDWAMAMRRAGWEVYFVPDAEICHLQGKSIGPSVQGRIQFHRARLQYFQKWHPRTHRLLAALCAGRVAVNLLLNGLATGCTLGLHAPSRNRLLVQAALLRWYLRGCPR